MNHRLSLVASACLFLLPLVGLSALGTLKIEYYRFDSAYTGWGAHLWDGDDASWSPTTWTNYPKFTGTDLVGGVTFRTLTFDASSRTVPGAVLKFIVHNGDAKDMGGADQSWPTTGGIPAPTIYCIEGNPSVFTDPTAAAAAAVNDLAFATVVSPTQVAVNLLGPFDGTTTLTFTDATGAVLPGSLSLATGATAGTWVPASALDFTKAPLFCTFGTLAAHLVGATGSVVDAHLTPPTDTALGPVYANGGVSLRFWSPFAKSVLVDFFSGAADANSSPVDQAPMVRATDGSGVWTLDLASLPTTNAYYQYRVDFGEASGPRHVLDPYAKAMGLWRQAAWSSSDPVGKGYLVDPSTVGPSPGAYYGSGTDPYVYRSNRDAIIYEASLRDFTSDKGLSLARGTYGGFQAVLPHFQNLGVTHLQLMPILQNYFYDQAAVGNYESGTAGANVTGNNYNWGYDPQNYFTPTGMYSAHPEDPASRIAEVKSLIGAIHQAGMGVILDVVFNHTATTNVLGDAVPGYYYRFDALGSYKNNSGCGNDVRTEAKMARKLIVDSLVFWMTQYKVDGFRFDIMGLVDTGTVAAAYQAAKAINPHVIFEGEGWQNMYDGAGTDYLGKAIAGSDQAHTGWLAATPAGMFNDGIRSLLKGGGMGEGPGFLSGSSQNLAALYRNIAGTPTGFSVPSSDFVMNYMTVHDNLCLYDAIANGQHLTASAADAQTALQRMRVGYTAVLTSQGTSFLYGGDEMFRTREIGTNAVSNVVHDGVTGRTFVSNAYNAT
ncbi:MAG TPA: alpha-amylase family glycosyl hydrolase, partial [Spirochaetia bacterium]|nr:alpha-amylase family glycosyl hydrolase [Spirochaetia bacterium]